MTENSPATLAVSSNTQQIDCHGSWTLSGISKLYFDFKTDLKAITDNQTSITIDGNAIKHMDSGGAWKLQQLIKALQEKNIEVKLQGFSHQRQALIALTQEQTKKITKPKEPKKLTWLEQLGKRAITQLEEVQKFLTFIGKLTFATKFVLRSFHRLRWSSIFGTIETAGYQALPIIALLSFMIGVVLAYQMGVQLRNYGANVYVVDLLGLSVLREFGPLLTAIMVAGRTGSAFTAQLGTMKLNQEIDALNSMGIPPNELLILPRLLGLFITLPLLTVWSDIFGLLGGMVMSQSMLDITFHDFLHRFAMVIPLKSLFLGIGKTPVFALLIASIGCFQGMQVLNSADSVGKQTTKSVVQAIFFIIVADAIFSVLFSKFKL